MAAAAEEEELGRADDSERISCQCSLLLLLLLQQQQQQHQTRTFVRFFFSIYFNLCGKKKEKSALKQACP